MYITLNKDILHTLWHSLVPGCKGSSKSLLVERLFPYSSILLNKNNGNSDFETLKQWVDYQRGFGHAQTLYTRSSSTLCHLSCNFSLGGKCSRKCLAQEGWYNRTKMHFVARAKWPREMYSVCISSLSPRLHEQGYVDIVYTSHGTCSYYVCHSVQKQVHQPKCPWLIVVNILLGLGLTY